CRLPLDAARGSPPFPTRRSSDLTTPGATTSLAQLLGLIPVAVMVLVDPRRRPLRATVAYALVLFALMAVRLASLPAFRPIVPEGDRKSTRLNSSHDQISYAVLGV